MIVVESGGTKSTWVYRNASGTVQSIQSVGLHPRELSPSKHNEVSNLIKKNQFTGEDIYFFGAGCESEDAKNEITQFFSQLGLIPRTVATDIYAACIAHLGHETGVVGILGTGAIAAKFDGKDVIEQTSGLGYLIGDEGSGFDIGKRLLQKYFRDQLPNEIKKAIEEYFNPYPILHRIYANNGRFMIAGLTRIAIKNRDMEIVHQILHNAFSDYCVTALAPLRYDGPIHFIGSVAYYFKKELCEVLLENGYQLGNIEPEAAFLLYNFLSNKINR